MYCKCTSKLALLRDLPIAPILLSTDGHLLDKATFPQVLMFVLFAMNMIWSWNCVTGNFVDPSQFIFSQLID